MINFDAVDFSERRSEEVISFFWRSVYMKMKGMEELLFNQISITCECTHKSFTCEQDHMYHMWTGFRN